LGHGSVCEGIPDFEYEDTFTRTMECYDDYSDIGVFIYLGDELTIDECQECKPPDVDDENVVAYYFEIQCEPVCEDFALYEAPSAAVEELGCYGGIAVKKIAGEDSMCGTDNMPFVIEEFAGVDSKRIEFSFTNSWDATPNDIELRYNIVGDGDERQSLNSLAPGSMYPNVLAAGCDTSIQTYTEIEVIISYEDGSCSFEYQLPCTEDVVICGDSDTNRKLENNVAVEANIDEGEDAPYCAHKDYPCEGDEESMVYVCHYSSRAGYQTFCMPEMDSDVIRFNRNHHCGQCDGWNGDEQSVQVS